ncbi:MAG: RNase adapter RapZ [Comamonas sp.]|nr:RNase adapter RapZ [Comamonas sp.]
MSLKLEIVLVTGMAGSGKSVALHALEDAGYYCVDNLPPELLPQLIRLQIKMQRTRLAIGIDARSAASLTDLPRQVQKARRLKSRGILLHVIFLDAGTSTLVRRFSETRRRHPLSAKDTVNNNQVLVETIEHERELLGELREHAHVIDTSNLRGSQLQSYVKDLLQAPADQMTLVFQSFGFKHGIPVDADYVFDVRMLPNPYYDLELRPLTGKDLPVQEFLRQQPDVSTMQAHITQFLDHWLPVLSRNHRSYVTVAIGCTGGQHRSVFLVEQLGARYQSQWSTLRRHREMDGRTQAVSTASH